MYHVLIVDDEYWVGRWLKELLEKSPFEMGMIEVCQEVEAALSILKQKPVDILITDINMPVLTGLELIKYTKESGRKVPKAIVISGYDEFEYARQAIELEVLAYLIKPLEREAVYGAVKKAIDSLELEHRQIENAQTGYHAMVENILLELFCHPQNMPKERLAEIIAKRNLNGHYYVLGMIQNAGLEISMLVKEHLQDKLEKACRSRHVFLVRRDVHTWIFLVVGIENPSGFYIEQNVLLGILNGYLWGVSRPRTDFMELEEAVLEARDDIWQQHKRESAPEPVMLESEMKRTFLDAMEARDKEKIKQCSCEQEEAFLKSSYDITSCLNFYFILTGEILELLTDSYRQTREQTLLELIEEGYDFCVRIRGFYSIRPICRKFLEYSLKVVDCLKDAGPMTVSAIVLKVQRMMREQYASNLSLGAIADEFSINPSYFSKKFKDETGVNFVDYLSGVRIEQAKALLKNTDFSVAKISDQVGFHDARYFSKVFVSIVGMKPTEYRAECREDGTI
ncbi:MAG: helix-turn-helix domain-containing protein [Hungatella hathewayi]|nr:helix-turn-helix domain-containing protein [Hungatella hathewayi]